MGFKNYITCKLTDGTFFDFDRMCNKINDYSEDMISFLCENDNNDDNKFICLGIIPKNQIAYILFYNSKETFEKLLNEENQDDK